MTGRLWPFQYRDGETSPVTRLLARRNPDPRPDGCLRDQRGRRHRPARLPHVESAWRPRVPGVGGRSRGNPRPAPRWRGYGVLARDEDAKGQWRHTQVTRPIMWFPSSRTCSACGRVNAKLKRERTWNCPNCGTRHDRNLTRCHQPEEPDHARRPKPGWAGSGGNGSTGAPASRQGDCGIVPPQKVPPLLAGSVNATLEQACKAGVPGVEARITES